MRAGYLIRQEQALERAGAKPCPSCQHRVDDHHELGYGQPGHVAGRFHCDHDGCDCVLDLTERS